MKIIDNPQRKDWSTLLQRPTQTIEDIENTVIQIFDDIMRHGDKAIMKYTAMFDGVTLNSNFVSETEIIVWIAIMGMLLNRILKNFTWLKIPIISLLKQQKVFNAGWKNVPSKKSGYTFQEVQHLYFRRY